MMWSDDQKALLSTLGWRIQNTSAENKKKQDYYAGKAPIKNLSIAVPENMRGVSPVLGWPSTVVDVIAERLDFQGFTSPVGDDVGEVLDNLCRISSLDLEVAKAVTDSLVYGVGFLTVTEVDGLPRVTAVDPLAASFLWDDEGEHVRAGMVRREDRQGKQLRTLYLPDETLTEVMDGSGAIVVESHRHDRGVAGLVPILNRVRSGRARGHSEITEAVRYATDNGARTLLGMEYNREIYTAPQRYTEGAYADDLGLDSDNPTELKKAAFKASMSHFMVVPPTVVDDSAETVIKPTVGQFSSSPPTPYIEQMRALTQLIAAEAAIPVHYLGFITDNPSSADAIRQSEARLVKKAEMKQRQLSQVLIRMVAPLMWRISTGESMPSEVRASLDVLWRDPATPTKAAMADAGTKLAAAGVMPPRSGVLYDMLGISRTDQRRLEADWAKDTSRALVGDLADRAAKARAESTAVANLSETTTQAEWDGDDEG